MAQLPKYEQVMSVIERRVREGDYLLNNIPGERKIAEETGVSYMTARRAVTGLLDKRILIRRPNGTLDVHPKFDRESMPTKIALLYPSYPSPYLAQLRRLVSDATESHDLAFRPVQYVHWDDPIVLDAVRNPGGALLIPAAEKLPSWILAALRSRKVAVLDGDVSAEGVPSIQLFSDGHIRRGFEHLHRLGHRVIDCINTQHDNPEIDRRIRLWRDWVEDNDCSGALWNDPAASFSDPTPHAHQLAADLIDHQRSDATAFVCTTFPAAFGVIRAFWERGLRVGSDVSVCSVNIEPRARYCCPSITGLDTPDLSGVLDRCLDWFSQDRPWRGNALLTPKKRVFFAGESTGPGPAHDGAPGANPRTTPS